MIPKSVSTSVRPQPAASAADMTTFRAGDHQHVRYNPLRGDWVLVSPHRMQRPWSGQVEKLSEEERPEFDPSNPLAVATPARRAGGRGRWRPGSRLRLLLQAPEQGGQLFRLLSALHVESIGCVSMSWCRVPFTYPLQ